MSSSNCCFLTRIQVSQEAGQVVWYSYLFQNFPQFIVIHTVKGFGIVNKAEIDVFLPPYDRAIPLLGVYLEKKENTNSQRYMYTNVQSSIIYNSQDIEATQVFISR